MFGFASFYAGNAIVRDQRGSFSILTAFVLPCTIAATALAVDLGSLYLERRVAQGAVDLAAMVAANDLDHADAAAARTMSANSIERLRTLVVTKGVYVADSAIPSGSRFTPDATPYNAVRVSATTAGQTFFSRAFGFSDPKISVEGLGIASAEASFSLGSRLLSVRDGIPNKLLGALLGGNVSLSVMDYRALLDANIQIGSFMKSLATELNITAGTYNDVLKSNAKVGDVLSAAANVLQQDGHSAASAALATLLGQSSARTLSIPLNMLIDLGSAGSAAVGQSAPGLGAALNVLDLVNASAGIANANHQVQLDLGATIPGVASLKVDLTIGERAQQSPWVRVGQPGSVLRTAQTRLRIVAEVGGSGLLSGVKVRLPLAIDLAYAEARLAKASCESGSQTSGQVEVAVRPGVARVWIGEMASTSMSNLSASALVTPAAIVSTAALKITGKAFVETGNISETSLHFSSEEIAANTVKTADSSQLVESLVTSLLPGLSLEVQVLGLSLVSSTLLKTAVTSTLATVAKPLDETIYTLLTALGIHVGEADVWVGGVRCKAAVLAG